MELIRRLSFVIYMEEF